jgi:tetratricopeptide (TPR) repeat protein
LVESVKSKLMRNWHSNGNSIGASKRIAPKLALAHANLRRTYAKADRPQDALKSLDQALQLNPNLQWAVELRDKIR